MRSPIDKLFLCALVLAAASAPAAAETPLGVELVISDLERPVRLVAPAGDPRLFVVQQTGAIEVFTNEGTGTLVVADTGSLTAAEQGVDKNG